MTSVAFLALGNKQPKCTARSLTRNRQNPNRVKPGMERHAKCTRGERLRHGPPREDRSATARHFSTGVRHVAATPPGLKPE